MCSLSEYVNCEVAKEIANNYDLINNSLIKEIDPEVYLKYNSVNILCGKQGKGKTLTILREIIKICNVPNCDVHMLVYVNRDGREDATAKVLSSLITIPIVYVPAAKVKEYFNQLIGTKMAYDKLKNLNLFDKIVQRQQDEIKNCLHIDNFSYPTLQEVILFDDAAFSSLFSKKDSGVVRMIHQARHHKVIFCFCVQGIQDIPLPLKEQTTTFFLYSGFIRQKLPTIYSQCGIRAIDYQEFKQIYNSLKEKDFIVIDCITGNFKIEDNADLSPLINYFLLLNEPNKGL